MFNSSPRIGVVGGGTMGVGIAYVFAIAGHEVTVVERSERRRVALPGELRGVADTAVDRGLLTGEDARETLARLHVVEAVAKLDERMELVVESVPEHLDLKCSVLAEIAQRHPRILATNTSSIPIRSLVGSVADPKTFLGMHFFNPVWSLKLVELIRGADTADATVTRAQTLVAGIAKESIVVADVAGFATSRLDFAAALEAMRMYEDKVASADDIDRAATLAYRHPVGPLRLSDIVGLDVRLDIARLLEAEYGGRFAPPQILVDLVAAGHLGRKSGRGFHEWTSPTATRLPD